MYIFSIDCFTSNNELCVNECNRIPFISNCTCRCVQVSKGWIQRKNKQIREMIFRIGRRAPLAVLILISGLSSVSLAITLLGTGLIK
jgi:hypothetical protein